MESFVMLALSIEAVRGGKEEGIHCNGPPQKL